MYKYSCCHLGAIQVGLYSSRCAHLPYKCNYSSIQPGFHINCHWLILRALSVLWPQHSQKTQTLRLRKHQTADLPTQTGTATGYTYPTGGGTKSLVRFWLDESSTQQIYKHSEEQQQGTSTWQGEEQSPWCDSAWMKTAQSRSTETKRNPHMVHLPKLGRHRVLGVDMTEWKHQTAGLQT